MKLDLSDVRGWIEEELVRCRPVGESMSKLIDRCEFCRPHPDWARLRLLSYSDLFPIIAWIKQPFQCDPPDRPLKGLWFGLFNPIYDDGDEGCVADIYIAGTLEFDPNPLDNSWVVSPHWRPIGQYARSSVLASIYRIAYADGGLRNDAEFSLCLGYGAFAIREALGALDPTVVLGKSTALGVAVGFDSGDFIILGEFRTSGLATTANISRVRTS